jgi:hypothetical protein
MRKTTVGRLMAIVVAGLASLALVVPAAGQSTAAAPGASKQGLVGPAARVLCVGLDPAPGDDVSQPGPGFVVFSQDRDANTVSANVVLKDAAPNTTYPIRLIQSDGSNCFTVDATLTTNKQGNGQAKVVEPIHPGATAVQVIIDTGTLLTRPTYRAPEKYTLVAPSGPPSAAPSGGSTATSASP